MPIEIDFGRELGAVAFPDDVTEDQAQQYVRDNYQAIRQGLLEQRRQELAAETEAEEKAKFQLGEYGAVETALNTLSELPRGALEGIGGGLKAFARVFESGAPDIEISPEEQRRLAAESPITAAGQAVQEFGRETYPGLPGVRETIPAQIMAGLGSTAAVLPAALVGGPAAPLTAGLAYGLQAGESALQEADATINRRIAEALANQEYDLAADLQDRREQMKSAAFITKAPIGALTEGMLGAAPRVAQRFVTGRIGGIGTRLAESLVPKSAKFQQKFLGVTGAERVRGATEALVTEGAQESLEQLGGNIAAGAVYDPERGWLDGVAQAGLIGAASGGIVGGLAGSRRNADLADAAVEAVGGNPANPLPRSSATVAGIEDTQQEGEAEITAEDVLKMSQETGFAGQEEVVTTTPTPKAKPAPAAPEVDVVRLDQLRLKADAGTINPEELAELTVMHQKMGIPDPVVRKAPAPEPPPTPAAPVDTETGLTPDEQDELDQLITAEDAGLLSEEGAITLAAYRSRLGFPAQPSTPTPSAVQEQGADEGVLRRKKPQPPVQVELREVDQGGRPAEVGGAEAEVTPAEVQAVKAEVVPETPAPAISEAVELNELRIAKQQRGRLGRLNEERLQELERKLAPAPAPAPAPTPAPGAPAVKPATEIHAAKLPKDLAGAKPRYNYATAAFMPAFDSDFDRAAFIVTQQVPSKRDADYLNWALTTSGLTEKQVKAHGVKVRAQLRQMAAGAKGGTQKAPAALKLAPVTIDVAPAAAPEPAPAPAPAPVQPTLQYTDADFAAAPSREAAGNMAVTQVRTNPSLPPRPPQIFYTLEAVANRAAKRPYDPKNLTAELIKQAQDSGLLTAAKNPKLTADGQRSLADGQRQSQERKAAQANLSDALRERAVLAWDAANDPQSAAYRERIAARPAAAPAPTPAPTSTPAPQSDPNEKLAAFIEDVDSAITNLESPAKLRAMVKKAVAAGYITARDAAEIASVQKSMGSAEDTTDAFGEFAGSLNMELEKRRKAPAVAPTPAPVSKVDQAIAKLENLKIDTGGTFDAVLGIPALVWNGALITAQNALRAGRAVTQAIDAAIEYIRANLNEKQAAKVNLEAVRNQFETDLVLGRSASEIVDDGKLSGYKQKARHLIPEERRKLRSDTKKRFVDLFNKLPSVSEFAAAALGGAVKRGWYRKSAEALIDVFGVDAPRFAALLAGLSPQTSVESNLINALNVWKNWNLAGRPTDRAAIVSVMGRSVQGTKGEESVLDAWINNSVRALSSEDPTSVTLSGPKVNSFMLNLRGVVNEVTNDAWMANFALVDQAMFSGSLNAAGTDPGKGTGYLAMSAKVRAAAEYLTELTGEQWTPAEVQETVWSWAKTLYELQDRRGETRNALEILRAGELTEEAIAGTPDFATLLADGEYRRILAEAGYGNQVEQLARRSAELRGAGQARSASQAAAAASQTLRNAEERAARRLVQLRKQRAAEAEAERNQRPDRVEALLQKVIAATDPKGKSFEAITALSSVVIYQATKIALRIYQATKSWIAARDAGMDYIKSHVQLRNEPETSANFEEFIKGIPNQEIPAGTPELPQPPNPAERVESRGLFLGEIERDTDENWAAEARKWVDFYKGNLERAYQVAMTANIDNAFREYVFAELLQRSELEVARAKNDVDLLRALNLQERIANSEVKLGAATGKAMAARKLSQERYWWLQPVLVYRNLVRKRQADAIPFPGVVSQQVRRWLVQSGREAIEQVREAMKQADKVFAREFKKIKAVPGAPGEGPIEINWREILTKSIDSQGSVRQKMLQVILADPRLRNLSPAGIAEITNLLTNAWEKQRNRIFTSEFRKKVPLPTVSVDNREKLFRALPRILRYANIARALPGDVVTTDGPETFLLWEQAFRDAVAPEFGVAEINGATARKLTAMAQEAQKREGINRNEIIQQMFRLMQREGGVNFSDALRDYWYAAVLSGTRTQVDNALNILNGALNTAMFAAISGRDAGLIAYSALRGLDEGIRDFWPMLWRGELYRSVNFNPDQPGNALEGLGESRNLFAKGISQMKYVSRLIQALDHVTALMSDSAAKAYALRKELTPEAARALMIPTAKQVADARAQAISEGTRPDLVNKRTREILQSKFPTDVLLTSKEIREMVTFTEVPQGLLGSIYEGLNAASRRFPALKFVTGTNFVRFAVNYTNELLNYAAPIAAWRWYKSAPGPNDQPGGLQFSQSRRDLLLAKAAIGTALGAFAAALFLGDDDKEEDRNIDITGSFKSLDPNKRKQLLAEGRQPYSIRFGNTYVSYRQFGFGGLLGAIGELRDRQLFSPDKWNQESITDKMLDAAAAGLLIVKDSSAISGLTEFLGFANAYKYDTSEVIEKAVPRYVARLAGSLVPNILKEVDAWSDPSIFKAEGGNLGYEYFLQQVPYARREIGPGPILNVLGEPAVVERYPWSRWVKERREDVAWDTLGRLASRGVFMPTPAITVKVNENGTRRQLNRDEAYQYQIDVGRGYRKFIEQNSKRLLALPPEQASELIDKNADRIRRDAREKLQKSIR